MRIGINLAECIDMCRQIKYVRRPDPTRSLLQLPHHSCRKFGVHPRDQGLWRTSERGTASKKRMERSCSLSIGHADIYSQIEQSTYVCMKSKSAPYRYFWELRVGPMDKRVWSREKIYSAKNFKVCGHPKATT